MRSSIVYIIIIILSVLLMACCQECSRRGSLANQNYEALTDSIRHYKNKLGTQTASIRTMQLNNSQMQKILINKDKELAALVKEFSKVRSVVKYQAVTLFDTIQVIYKDTVPYIFNREGQIKKDWYSFKYQSGQQGIVIDSFKTWTSSIVITGIKRKWFLGKSVLTTDITNTNPHIEITGIKAAEITLPEPFYKKWYIWLALGLAGGYLIAR